MLTYKCIHRNINIVDSDRYARRMNKDDEGDDSLVAVADSVSANNENGCDC